MVYAMTTHGLSFFFWFFRPSLRPPPPFKVPSLHIHAHASTFTSVFLYTSPLPLHNHLNALLFTLCGYCCLGCCCCWRNVLLGEMRV